MSDWKKLGAFWKKESKSGKKFLAGEIEINGVKTKITCWPNTKGDNPKRPDFVIYLSEDAPTTAAAARPGTSDADESVFPDSEIPF